MDDETRTGDLTVHGAGDVAALDSFLRDNELWLMQGILAYASDHGYTAYTSTLEEAWRMSIAGLSESLVMFVVARGFNPELEVHEDIGDDPAIAFGVAEANTHRSRGVSLQMFMALMKYYRRSYLDMIVSQASSDLAPVYTVVVERFFDRVEIGYCVEWSGLRLDDTLANMQRANREITNEKNKYLTLFESLDTPVFLLDSAGVIDNLNHAAAQLLGIGEGVGEGYYSGVGVGGRLYMLDADVSLLFESGLAEVCSDRALETCDGLHHYQVRLKRMLDISGKFSGATVALSDITQLKASHDHFRTLSNTDALTGLLNLRGLEIAAEVLSQSMNHDRADLVFIDLDGMKATNDQFGHAAGDAMLKAFAEALTSAFRSSDIIARVGGDEFVGLLFRRHGDSAQSALDRLDAAISRRNTIGDLPTPISASVGVASCELGTLALDLHTLLADADSRMYANKQRAHESRAAWASAKPRCPSRESGHVRRPPAPVGLE